MQSCIEQVHSCVLRVSMSYEGASKPPHQPSHLHFSHTSLPAPSLCQTHVLFNPIARPSSSGMPPPHFQPELKLAQTNPTLFSHPCIFAGSEAAATCGPAAVPHLSTPAPHLFTPAPHCSALLTFSRSGSCRNLSSSSGMPLSNRGRTASPK